MCGGGESTTTVRRVSIQFTEELTAAQRVVIEALGILSRYPKGDPLRKFANVFGDSAPIFSYSNVVVKEEGF